MRQREAKTVPLECFPVKRSCYWDGFLFILRPRSFNAGRQPLQRPRHVQRARLRHTGDATLGRWLGRRRFDSSGFEVGEEGGEDADGREERAKMVDKIQAG